MLYCTNQNDQRGFSIDLSKIYHYCVLFSSFYNSLISSFTTSDYQVGYLLCKTGMKINKYSYFTSRRVKVYSAELSSDMNTMVALDLNGKVYVVKDFWKKIVRKGSYPISSFPPSLLPSFFLSFFAYFII